MKLIRSVQSSDLAGRRCVLTIGNFDAVHIGHQNILRRLKAKADELDLPLVLMTFDPHPEEYFLGQRSAPRLSTVSSRYFALQQFGVDVMLLLPFNKSLANTSAEDFIQNYLVRDLGVQFLLVGDEFRFGKDRLGDFSMLQQFGKRYGFGVEDTETIIHQGDRVSSTRIRHLLGEGDLDAAARLLNRRYNMTGRVIYGQQLGRQWGFPTLNLAVNFKPALTGVFAVQAILPGNEKLPGVANLGTRPTVGGLKTLLEVHIFDFSRDLYGQRICVEFVSKIRGEQKFDSFDALKAQIMRDADTAKNLLEVN